MLKAVVGSSGGGGGAPTGPAGGSLAGTYPNPTIAGTVATVAHGIVIQQSAAPVSHTGDTAEFTLATISVPAIPANTRLRITLLYSCTGTANTKTSKIYFGAAGAGTGGTLYSTTAGAASALSIVVTVFTIVNVTTSSQVSSTINTAPVTTSSVTTTTATELTITGQLANSGDSITLLSWLVETILP